LNIFIKITKRCQLSYKTYNIVLYTNQGMGECQCDWIWTLHVEWLWVRRGNVGYKILSLARTKGVTALGRK